MKKLAYALLIFCFLGFGKENCYSQQSEESYVKAAINGNTLVVQNKGFGKVHAQLIEMLGYFELAIIGMTIDDNKAKSVAITVISEKSFSTISAGKQWNAKDKTLEDLPLGSYSEQSDAIEFSADSENTEDAYFKITFIDKANRIISGEFGFTATNNENTYKVTKGVFNKISY